MGIKDTGNAKGIVGEKNVSYDSLRYAFIDLEVGVKDCVIHDIGALRYDDMVFHKAARQELLQFLANVDYLCGHNIIHHDAKYLFKDEPCRWLLVDTDL